MTYDQIEKFTNDMVKQADSIKLNAIKLSWFMRGGMRYEDIMNLSYKETELVNSMIEENLETTKKSKLPFF
jgi:hypothetical protein